MNSFDAISGAAFGGGGGGGGGGGRGRGRGPSAAQIAARRASAAKRARDIRAHQERTAANRRQQEQDNAKRKRAIQASIRAAEKKERARLDGIAAQKAKKEQARLDQIAANKAKQTSAKKSWHEIGGVVAGRTTTVEANGKVKIECADYLGGMHLNACDFYGSFQNLDSQGNTVGGMYPNYKGNLVSGAFNLVTGTKTFDVEDGAKKWTFKLNDRPAVSDNAGIPQLKIYEWR